jgi:glycosyltransferase involved in cell wall biosynthesis
LGLFVEIAERLLAKNHNFRFVIVGDGPERKKIENMIGQKKLTEYFCLPGQVENFIDYVQNFDIFLLTSSKEGFPYILLEVGMGKIPIVASKVGGVGELIIDRQTGYLVKKLTAEDFVEKIKEALGDDNAKITNDLHQKIVDEFSLEKMMDSYKREYLKK